MKKILLINDVKEINEVIKQKTNFIDDILVFDYKLAIICTQKKIKFQYINDLNKRSNKYQNLSNLLSSSHDIAKKIDKKIHLVSNNLKNKNFFSNYQKFSLCNLFLEKYYNNLNFLIKKYPKAKFYYFENKKNNFDFLIECIDVLKLKYKKKFFKVFKLKNRITKNTIYPELHDDLNFNILKNIYRKISNISSNNRISILIYLLEKSYLKKVEAFAKKNNINLIHYNRKILKKKYFKEIFFKKKFKLGIFKDKTKDKYYEKFIIYLVSYVINEAEETFENASKLFEKNNIKLFCSSHNTLISNSLRQFFNKKNIKTLMFLHGGTVGHFKKGFFWPDLSHTNLSNKKISFIQTFSEDQLKGIKKNDELSYLNKNIKYISFKPETFTNSKFLKKTPYSIGYITQSNGNILTNLNQGNNDPFNLYKSRNKFLKEIINNQYNFKLYVSLTENNENYFCDENLLNKAKNFNKIILYKWNAIEILKKVNTVILEQPSTTLIESLFFNIPKIIVINNPLWDFENSQKKMLGKRIIFARNYDDINEFLFTNNNKNPKNNVFLKKYYLSKKNQSIDYFLKRIFS